MGFISRFERKAENAIDAMTDRFSNAPVSPAAIAKRCEKRMHADRMVGAGKQYAPTLYTVLVNPQDDRAMMGYYPTLSGELETHMKGAASEAGLVMDGQPLVRFIADNSLRPGKFEVIAETVTSPIVEQLRDDELQRYGITRGRYEAELARKQSMAREQAREMRRSDLRGRGERPQRTARPQREERRDIGGMFGNLFKGRDADDGYDDGYEDEYVEPELPPVPGQNRYGLPTRPSGKRPLPYVPEEEIDRSVDYGEYTFNSLNFDDYDENGEPLAEEPPAAPEPDSANTGVPTPVFDEEPEAPATPAKPSFEFEEPVFDEPDEKPVAEEPPAPVMPPQGRPSRPFPPQGYPQQGQPQSRPQGYPQGQMQSQPQGRPSRPFPPQGYPQQSQPQGRPQGYPQGQGQGRQMPQQMQGRQMPPQGARMQGQPGMPQGRPSRPFPPQGYPQSQAPAGAQSIPLRSQEQQRAAAQIRQQQAQQAKAPAVPAVASEAPVAAAPVAPVQAAPVAPAAPERPARILNVPSPAEPETAAPAQAAPVARPQRPAGVREPEVSYREPVSFTPASRIAPEAAAMPAAVVPGILNREEQPETRTTAFKQETPAPAAPAAPTLPYTDVRPPAPRYRIRNMADGRSYTLTGTRVYIGRETTCNIVVNDANASRRHAELRSNGRGVWTISDLDSTNGTFLNGEAVTSSPLADGDRITVGTTDLVFVVC